MPSAFKSIISSHYCIHTFRVWLFNDSLIFHSVF